MEKKIKKKLSFKGLIVVLLGIYLVLMVGFVIYRLPVRNIVIIGNNLTSEKEIVEAANIKINSSLWHSLAPKTKKNIKDLDFISDAKITFNLLGKVTIKVTEERPLFFYERNQSYVLTDNEEIKTDHKISGVPTLINFVPSETIAGFVDNLKKIDPAIILMISEIKYDPEIWDDITIDAERFLLKMNDENCVYVNIVNLEKLDKYKEIIASLGSNDKGILHLDSNLNNTYFETYAKIKADEEKEVENNELPNDANKPSE